MRRPTFLKEDFDDVLEPEIDSDETPALNGLAGLLTSRDAFESEVSPTKTPNLDLIVAGSQVPNPSEILSNSRFDELLAWAKENYDYVIVDSPPILGLADAPLIGAKVDASLLVVESGELMSKNVNSSIERLKQSGTNLLGVVLTKYKAPTNAYGYYDYTYGSESYSYGKTKKVKDKKTKTSKRKMKL
jgi:capsular exopolysaccharide synthesis family protein